MQIDYMKIGEQIKTVRKGKGYKTCAKLAKAINCSPETIRRIERGENEPSMELLKIISRVLNYSFIIKSESDEKPKPEISITSTEVEKAVEDSIDEPPSLDEPWVPEP